MRPSFCVLLVVATAAGAQAPAITAPAVAATTPAECTKILSEWRNAQLLPVMTAMRSGTTEARADASSKYPAIYSATAREFTRATKACAEKFDLATIPSAQLVDLAALYGFAGDTASRRRATERSLTANDLPPRQHALALTLGMAEEVARSGSYFGLIDGAERMVDRIDALPDSLADVKLNAHSSMLGRYEYLDVNEGLRKHATALIALGRRLNNSRAMMMGSLSLARSAADRLQPDSALMILDKAEKELGSAAAVEFGDFRGRYALIGTKAAPIAADWWLDTSSPETVQPADGKVRLVEFTAHWCVPCKNSYPGLRSLAERFRGQNFEGVMVTSLFGYVGTRRDLGPEEELEADRDYYGKEHALPFKVAVNRQVPRAQPKPDQDYHVAGIPQIVIVDRRGVIRQIVIGWDQGNTQRIGDLIARLLDERLPK